MLSLCQVTEGVILGPTLAAGTNDVGDLLEVEPSLYVVGFADCISKYFLANFYMPGIVICCFCPDF